MKTGVQLFTLRKYLKDADSYERIFGKVKEMGAEVVQISVTLNKVVDSKTLAKISKDNDLPICITHSDFNRISNDLDNLASEHLEFGCKNIGIGMMPKQFRTGKLSDIKLFVDILNETSLKLSKYGMKIAYHNHWFEFDNVEGEQVFDYMIDNTDVAVNFIPDTFWIKVGGGDIIAYLEKLNGRINTLHLKDYKKTLGLPIFRAIGKGELDFKKIITVANSSGVENSVVELDLSPNPLKSVKFSLDYLKTIIT